MRGKPLNILVTGGNGQLGRCIRDAAAGSRNRYIFSDICELPGLETLNLDVTNPAAIDICADSEQIDVIVNCAGYTAVDRAESETVMADALNRAAAANLAATAKRLGALLIHISTDYIFGGNAREPIPENAEPAPLGVYGATKLAGERAITDSGCRHIILRTAWLYSQYGNNFVRTILRLAGERSSIRVVCDQTGSPTWAADLAAFIVGIIDNGKTGAEGIYNYSGEGSTTWYGFASMICELAGLPCKVSPCTTEEYPTAARRPRYSLLDKTLIKNTFGVQIPLWTDSLKACMNQII